MNILIAASECAPFIKVGGIADVIGSLPISLNNLKENVEVVIPYYKPLKEKVEKKEITAVPIAKAQLAYSGNLHNVTVHQSTLTDTKSKIYFIEDEKYITNGGIYYDPDEMDSPEIELDRFAFYAKCIVEIFAKSKMPITYDVIHCNDWHTGLVPQIIENEKRINKDLKMPNTIMTIHNLGYQGFSEVEIATKLNIDLESDATLKWDAKDDNLDYLLQGIVGADYISTVSERYSKEIQTEEFGEGLHEILKARKHRLYGILNGISYEHFNPKNDKHIYKNYDIETKQEGKLTNKQELQKEFGLEVNNDKPLIGVVSRLVYQKGLDFIADNIENILDLGYQFILLGTGQSEIEDQFEQFNRKEKYKNTYTAQIEYSNEIAMKIYAGCDMLLIPSRYEPSGLTQMIAMAFATIPVVRNTGGLADTVRDSENGFVFNELENNDIKKVLENALNTYHDKSKWHVMMGTCMKEDFSWKKSAEKYVKLYGLAKDVN